MKIGTAGPLVLAKRTGVLPAESWELGGRYVYIVAAPEHSEAIVGTCICRI